MGLAVLDNHSMRSLHLVDFINREFWESQMLCSSLGCRIQPLICSKWNGMVLFLSKKCSENDAYSRTSLKIINMLLSRPKGWRWTCHTKSCSVLPFQQRMYCCSELLYRTWALSFPFTGLQSTFLLLLKVLPWITNMSLPVLSHLNKFSFIWCTYINIFIFCRHLTSKV